MKFQFIIIFTLICTKLHSQPFQGKEVDTLRKYSHLILGVKPNKAGGETYFQHGTGFFFRYQEELILITNKHIVSDYSPFTLQLIYPRYDIISIVYQNNKETKYANLNLAPLKKYFPNTYFYKEADISILQIMDTNLRENAVSIDYILEEPTQDEIIERVYCFGYASDTILKYKLNSPAFFYTGVIGGLKNIDISYPLNDSIYYITTPVAIHGMSGSPVFIKYRSVNSKKSRILFGGVLFGGSKKYNSAYIVTARKLRELLKKFIHG